MSWRLAATLLALTAASGTFVPSLAETAEPNVIACSLHKSDGRFRGSCAVPCLVNDLLIDMAGPRPGAACTASPRTVEVTLALTASPDHLLGTMPGKFAEDPTRFEFAIGKGGAPGIAKTPFGWFPATATEAGDGTLTLSIDANRQLPPTRDDVTILERALAMLPDEAAWNRRDTRECPPHPRSRSLFCALDDATIETTGGLHYRQPALQAARLEVDNVFADVEKHRLMEFNNNPTTTLSDIRQVIVRALADIREDLPR